MPTPNTAQERIIDLVNRCVDKTSIPPARLFAFANEVVESFADITHFNQVHWDNEKKVFRVKVGGHPAYSPNDVIVVRLSSVV